MEGFISSKHLNILEERQQGVSVGSVVLLENVMNFLQCTVYYALD